MEQSTDNQDVCDGAENFPVYFVCDGMRQKLDTEGVSFHFYFN